MEKVKSKFVSENNQTPILYDLYIQKHIYILRDISIHILSNDKVDSFINMSIFNLFLRNHYVVKGLI